MRIPEGMTEEEVLAAIDKVCSRLAHKYRFAYHELEDIKQQGFLEAVNSLEKYKPDLPLENFLWRCIKNGLYNFKRNNFVRHDKPCAACPLNAYIKKGDICTAFKEKTDCRYYSSWQEKNERKKNVIAPSHLSNIVDYDMSDSGDADVVDSLSYAEIVGVIDNNISVENRPSWLKLKAGVKLHKCDMNKVRYEIKQILKENNIDAEEAWETES